MIVAELSANHLGDLNRALKLIDMAAWAGADAVKLQTYKPKDMIAIDRPCPDGPWKGRSLKSLYEEAMTPWHWHERLFYHARANGLLCFSSPFSVDAVRFLEQFNPPYYKIASFEITDLQLIEAAALTGKPLIISTGCATDVDIRNAIGVCKRFETQLTLLHCISNYPADPSQMNLPRIRYLQKEFGCDVGLSDHSLSTTIPAIATALGATIIEKHLTLARADGGPDAAFSLEPQEFKLIVDTVRETKLALQPCRPHQPLASMKRSLHAITDITQGDTFTADNIGAVRSDRGLLPIYLNSVIGKHAKLNITKGTPLSVDLCGL